MGDLLRKACIRPWSFFFVRCVACLGWLCGWRLIGRVLLIELYRVLLPCGYVLLCRHLPALPLRCACLIDSVLYSRSRWIGRSGLGTYKRRSPRGRQIREIACGFSFRCFLKPLLDGSGLHGSALIRSKN